MTKPARKVRKRMKAARPKARLVIPPAALDLPVDYLVHKVEMVLPPPSAFQKLMTWWRGMGL